MKTNYALNDVEKLANQLIKCLTSKVVLFYGEMGTGKTTLIKALAKALGSEDEVSSPTFSIVNEYECVNDKIYHFDLYRIEAIEEAYNFGIEDYLNSKHWIFIEWPELVEDLLPDDINSITLENVSEDKRSIALKIKSNNQAVNHE